MVWLASQGRNPSVNQLRSPLDLKVFFQEVIGKLQFLSLEDEGLCPLPGCQPWAILSSQGPLTFLVT